MFHVWPRLRIKPSLNQLMKKFAELPFGRIKHPLAFFGGRILAPGAASLSFHFDGEIAFLLQTMQQWIDRAGAQLVAMPRKLLNHPEANQGLLRCVVKNVQPYEAADKLGMIRFLRCLLY